MAKMTKAQARKRLTEAAQKVARVWADQYPPVLTTRETNELVKIHDSLIKMSLKLK